MRVYTLERNLPRLRGQPESKERSTDFLYTLAAGSRVEFYQV
jgi:hypothetical protein